jgi:hypothetical protein
MNADGCIFVALPPNKSLQRPPGGACPASCNCFYFCEQQAGQSPGAAELNRYASPEQLRLSLDFPRFKA